MATLKEFRSDLILLHGKLKPSKEELLTERHAQWLIHKYRSVTIRDDYRATREIDPSVLQDFGQIFFTNVLSSDDPAISVGSLHLGKIVVPRVVSLPGFAGYYRITSSSKHCQHYPIEMDMFFNIPPDSIAAKGDYFFPVNNAVYISPVRKEGNMVLILDNPMNGIVLLTQNVLSGDIQTGVSYTVQSGQTVYNGVGYNVGQSFTGTFGITTFSGTGVVKHTIQKRPITINDDYPMSMNMFEKVIVKLFYQEFKFTQNMVADAKNDAMAELVALQS